MDAETSPHTAEIVLPAWQIEEAQHTLRMIHEVQRRSGHVQRVDDIILWKSLKLLCRS